jgi:restriction system protein
MPIPDFQTIMLPLLKFVSDGKEHQIQEIIGNLVELFDLSEQDRSELLPSGKEPVFNNRVRWAGFHLNKGGLLNKPRRGFLEITQRGHLVLKQNPPKIDMEFLRRYPEYLAFKEGSKKVARPDVLTPATLPNTVIGEEQTPEEAIGSAYESVRDTLVAEILEQIKACSPEFFERLVVDLLVSMGYGGTRADAGQAVGKSEDGGIDGIINEDRLGLDVIYIQAKRWEATVGRPEIQQFAGALQGQKARKGVFITTSGFSKAATDYARNIESSLVLIDGKMLAGLMIDHDVGVTLETSYEVKRIDSDYFDEA